MLEICIYHDWVSQVDEQEGRGEVKPCSGYATRHH